MGIQERKRREKERRRQQIMVAARKVFLNKGIGKATMEDIAREAEISPGTIYLYFKSKDELCTSLFFAVLRYLEIRLEHMKADTCGRSVEYKLTAIQEALIDLYHFDPLAIGYMFRTGPCESMRNVSPKLLSRVEQQVQNALRKIAALFNNSFDRSIAEKISPEAVAEIMWALFSGFVIRHENRKVIGRSDDRLKSSLETAFILLARGLK